MKKNILTFVIILFTISLSFSQEYIFKFTIKNKSELNKLTNLISIDNVSGNEVIAYANQKEFENFKTMGYQVEILPHPAANKSLTMATTVAGMANWDKYPTHEVYVQMMNNLATDYPDICRLETIGVSEDGRDVLVLKITDNPDANEPEPEFFYTGQMHGDEIVTYIMFLRLADYILSNYGTDDRITDLVNNVEIWINPLSNPDGTYNGGNNTVSGATRSNSNGVDLNRNFPTPNLPNPSGVNAAEVQMMMDFADNHNFVLSANSHSGIELINYPWDTWESNTNPHADHNWLEEISHHYANTVHANAPGSYLESFGGVTHGGDWYIVDGSRQDYMLYHQNCREITLELSDSKLLDCEDLPTYFNYNQDAMIGYIEECLYGIYGTVTSSGGEQIQATISIDGHDADNSEVVSELETGSYIRMIAPGTYNVIYSAFGHISQTHSITISDYFISEEKNVVLLQAGETTLSGTVTEQQTGLPIENVQISFLEMSIENIYTNESGEYSINILEGDYQIQAYKTGYSSQVVSETINNENNVIDFQLNISDAVTFEGTIPCEFSFSGDTDWFQSNDEAFEGTYSIKSGSITHDQNSTMTLNISTDEGFLKFYKKVSCENAPDDNYDYLKFSIDGEEQSRWDGEINWSQESYAITSGSHIFKWEYIKDGNQSNGSDCAWIDNVEIPNSIFTSYIVSFEIKDGNSLIENSNITLEGYGNQFTNNSGITQFIEVCPASLDYTIVTSRYENVSGNIEVDGNETVIIDYSASDTQSIKLNLIKIYPNPSDGDFVVDFSHTLKTGEITISDIAGREILKQTTDKGFANVNLKDKKAGVYFIRINIDNEIFNTKIILQ